MLAEILPPTVCPSCEARLVWENDLLYCRNQGCPARSSKKVEHFAKVLKIKGLGPAAIEKLEIVDFDQIYSLSEEEISSGLGSEKLGAKLFLEIENSRSAPLELVLPAFGIPLIGNSATRKLSETIKHISEVTADSCASAGLGPKATENLLEWLHRDFYCFYDGCLPFDFKFSSTPAKSHENKGVVCISGRLKSFKTKADATSALNKAGYTVKSSITKDVTLLINEGGVESSKTKQAREAGIKIIENLVEFLGE